MRCKKQTSMLSNSEILKYQTYIKEVGMSEEDLVHMPHFSIKKMYYKFLRSHPIISWRRLVCNILIALKVKFCPYT